MQRNHVLPWVPLAGIAACTMGMALLSANGRCALVPWLCDDRSMALALQTMALVVLLPLLVCLSWGVLAGVMQFVRTRRALNCLLSVPRAHLPATLISRVNNLDIQDRLDVVDDISPQSFCYGFLRPRIYVTTGLLAILSGEEVEAVLRHERHHLQRRDPLRSLLWTVLDSACWWHTAGSAQAQLQRELVADRAVIVTGGRQALASALLKLLTYPGNGHEHHQELAISSLSVTDARIDQLLHSELAPLPPLALADRLRFPAATVVATLLCSLAMVYL
jgi:Zn-dependent protease with chaperone function